MTDEEIIQQFSTLYMDFDDFKFLQDNHPLLAHYTSLNVMEKILEKNEVWFSNPLFMNDLQEVRFGMFEGARLFRQNEAVERACGTKERAATLKSCFEYYYKKFDEEHAFDTYVFCLSAHDRKNTDGLLSMWRSYGGNGNGVALVFNTDFFDAPVADSPFIVARVHYDSNEARSAWLNRKITQWCEVLEKSTIPDDKLYISAHVLFNLIKLFALTFKHQGFSEEQEWRIVYFPERDRTKDKVKFHYTIGTRGVEPKLIFPIKPFDPSRTWTFETILDRIILGPSISSWLAQRGVERMLETLGKDSFKKKVCVSHIPLRPA